MKTRLYMAALVPLMLAACGGSGGGATPTPTPPVTTPPVVLLDAFFKAVQGIIGTAPDDSEPTDIAAVTPTEPENTEPEKVE